MCVCTHAQKAPVGGKHTIHFPNHSFLCFMSAQSVKKQHELGHQLLVQTVQQPSEQSPGCTNCSATFRAVPRLYKLFSNLQSSPQVIQTVQQPSEQSPGCTNCSATFRAVLRLSAVCWQQWGRWRTPSTSPAMLVHINSHHAAFKMSSLSENNF